MIGYVTLGTNDLARAAAFYDAIAGELGAGRFMEMDNFIAWGAPGGAAGIGLTRPFDGNAARAAGRERLLRRLFPRSRRQQVQCLRHGVTPATGSGSACSWVRP